VLLARSPAVALRETHPWWTGDNAEDLAEYLHRFEAGGYPVHQVVQARCPFCESNAFRALVDGEEGCVQRRCVMCGSIQFVADSHEGWDHARPEPLICPCGAEVFELSVGFSMRPDGEVRWISVGARCLTDGVLGVCADWEISYGPTQHLFTEV
jgi:hypothetical protein